MPYQTTLFSAIDPDVPLGDHVILLGDPRWADCLRELETAPWCSLDTEFFRSDGQPFTRNNIDHWKSVIRLIQVGLPSRRVLVLDLGGMLDDRDRFLRTNWDALQVVKRAVEDRTRPTIGMNLPTEYLGLRIHFGWKMRAMRDIMLCSQVIWAGVGAKGGYFGPQGFVKQPMLKHNMKAIASRLGIAVDKSEQSSDWAGRLSNRQRNYAATDTLVPIDVFWKLCEIAKIDGLMNSIKAECGAQVGFCECAYNGLPVDMARAKEDLAAWERVREHFQKAFRETFPGVNPDSPNQVAEVLGRALDVYKCGGCGLTYDPLEQHGGDQPRYGTPLADLPAAWRCPRCRGPRDGYSRTGRRNFIKSTGKPHTSDDVLAPYADVWYVDSLLEGRSVTTCMTWLRNAYEHARDIGDGHGHRVRVTFKQIAGGGEDDEKSPGRGMGRSSASKPLNTQNSGNVQPKHEAAGAPPIRRIIKPLPGRAFIVADLSQAHARIGAQWSQDSVMLRDFNNELDFHLAMTHRLLQKKVNPDLTFEEAVKIAEQDGKKGRPLHPMHKEFKARRQGCKSTNYAKINLSGAETLQRQMATMAVPIHMELNEVEDLIQTWNELYNVFYTKQREHIRAVNRFRHRFDHLGLSAEYGESRALTGRRLFLVKDYKKPFQRADGTMSKGYYSVKGTDAVSSIWMMTEADIMKYAMTLLVDDFDEHPEWDVLWSNMAHDELDLDCAEEYALPVATITNQRMEEAMAWAGITSLPVNEKGADPKKLIKEDWAAK